MLLLQKDESGLSKIWFSFWTFDSSANLLPSMLFVLGNELRIFRMCHFILNTCHLLNLASIGRRAILKLLFVSGSKAYLTAAYTDTGLQLLWVVEKRVFATTTHYLQNLYTHALVLYSILSLLSAQTVHSDGSTIVVRWSCSISSYNYDYTNMYVCARDPVLLLSI